MTANPELESAPPVEPACGGEGNNDPPGLQCYFPGPQRNMNTHLAETNPDREARAAFENLLLVAEAERRVAFRIGRVARIDLATYEEIQATPPSDREPGTGWQAFFFSEVRQRARLRGLRGSGRVMSVDEALTLGFLTPDDDRLDGLR